MLKIAKESKLVPAEAIKRAVAFFGPKGYGLKVVDECDTSASFEGGGGSVVVEACESKKGSSVDVQAVEWEIQAREFLSRLK
jgi:hypothetical protein